MACPKTTGRFTASLGKERRQGASVESPHRVTLRSEYFAMAPLQAAEYRERYKTTTPVNTIQISAAISTKDSSCEACKDARGQTVELA